MSERLKLKLLGRSVLKGKVGAHFPAGVTGISPILVTQSGVNYTISIDLDALAAIVPSENQLKASIICVLDGGGNVLTPGVKLDLPVPFNCTIENASLYADQAGSIVIDVWKDTHTNFPATGADSITAAAKPTLSGTDKALDSALTGWTTAIVAGDVLRFNVDSVAAITRCTLSMQVERNAI